MGKNKVELTIVKYLQFERRVSEREGSFHPAVLAPPEQRLDQTNQGTFQRVLHDLHSLCCVAGLDVWVCWTVVICKRFELKIGLVWNFTANVLTDRTTIPQRLEKL